MATGPLYKTTIVIWSDRDPRSIEIDGLAADATNGESYCSRRTTEVIDDPEGDPDWDNTEFFEGEL